MEQHPIPQAITTYQFRLIGDMTLRQFSQLAGGIIVAIFFYSLPITPFIKWFLVLFFSLLGFALAFLPLEDRPLDKWIVAFFRSVYSPTRFIWRKEKRVPDFLKETTQKTSKKRALSVNLPSSTNDIETSALAEYLESLGVSPPESKMEIQEKMALEKMETLFKNTKLPPALISQPKPIEPKEENLPQIRVKPRKLTVPPSESIALKINLPVLADKKKQFKPKPKSQSAQPLRIKISPKGKAGKPRVEAKTSQDLPIPSTPTQSNIIVGMILDREGKIIEKAIIEIRDKNGTPVRALRSNRLGQFQIVTPLPNGAYEIEIEKEGFNFDIIKLGLTNQIISPIEIRAK